MGYLESWTILSRQGGVHVFVARRPAQKPQLLTGFRATMIVQHDPPSTITIRCICEAGKDRTQGARYMRAPLGVSS